MRVALCLDSLCDINICIPCILSRCTLVFHTNCTGRTLFCSGLRSDDGSHESFLHAFSVIWEHLAAAVAAVTVAVVAAGVTVAVAVTVVVVAVAIAAVVALVLADYCNWQH